MISLRLHSSFSHSLASPSLSNLCSSPHKTSTSTVTTSDHVKNQPNSNQRTLYQIIINNSERKQSRFCTCGRRHFFLEAATTGFLSLPSPAHASDYKDVLSRVRPPRPDWYEEFYAWVLDSDAMKSYESEIAAYKSHLFSNLRGKAKKVLEIGIGIGSNFKYYASDGDDDVEVFGVDPNGKMEKYAQQAAEAAGLLPPKFKFTQAVGEAIPLSDASVDAVVGTLVLCSVTDVDQTLQEVKRVLRPGGLYLFVEQQKNVLDPLQQTVADGCHLTRDTGKKIFEAGFSAVDLNTVFLSSAAFTNPQVYGLATK